MKILYFLPSYHSSFFEREELIKRGHEVDIFVPVGYPKTLLWDETATFTVPQWIQKFSVDFENKRFPGILDKFRFVLLFIVTIVFKQLWLISLMKKYDRVYIFGRTEFLSEPRFLESYIYSLVKKGKITFRILPAGCRDEAPKQYWKQFDSGNICHSCFLEPNCDDLKNSENLDRIHKFRMKVGGNGSHNPPGLNAEHFKSRSLDLELWRPDLEVPMQFQLPPTDNVRVLHSFASNGRGGSVNIKGSSYIERAIKDLQEQGYAVELVSVTSMNSNEMRFIQAQCDIIVDQLIYGWWGSTALEGAASGKPVICYLRTGFVDTFLSYFPEYRGNLPIISAGTDSIQARIKELLDDPALRAQIGKESRIFAESFVSPSTNVAELERFLA